MDINELLYREQVSLANAASAVCEPSRLAHEGLAHGYAARLIAAGFPHRHYRLPAFRGARRGADREVVARPAGDILASMPCVGG
jgi:hypothetical protein